MGPIKQSGKKQMRITVKCRIIGVGAVSYFLAPCSKQHFMRKLRVGASKWVFNYRQFLCSRFQTRRSAITNEGTKSDLHSCENHVRDIVPQLLEAKRFHPSSVRLFFFFFAKTNKFMNMTRDVSVINYDCERNNQFRFLLSLSLSLPFQFSKQQQIKDELCEVVQEMESHDSENKHSSKEKQMSIGRKKFNMDPKKGKILRRFSAPLQLQIQLLSSLDDFSFSFWFIYERFMLAQSATPTPVVEIAE